MIGTDTEHEAKANHRDTQAPSPVTIQVPIVHNMKVNKNTKLALTSAAKSHSARKAKKSAVKMTAGRKAAKAREAYNGPTGELILVLSGSKGELFRRANVSKDGHAKLTHCANRGIKYDGATVDLVEWDKNSREIKVEAGAYVTSRGMKPEIKPVSLSVARGMCKHKLTVERANGKEVVLRVTNKDKQYAGSLEKFANGEGFGQFETKRLAHNLKHYGAFVKG